VRRPQDADGAGHDGPYAVKDFRCGEEPDGWSYRAVRRHPETGTLLGELELVLGADGRVRRPQQTAAGWLLRGGVVGDEVLWRRGEQDHVLAAHGGGRSTSPCFCAHARSRSSYWRRSGRASGRPAGSRSVATPTARRWPRSVASSSCRSALTTEPQHGSARVTRSTSISSQTTNCARSPCRQYLAAALLLDAEALAFFDRLAFSHRKEWGALGRRSQEGRDPHGTHRQDGRLAACRVRTH